MSRPPGYARPLRTPQRNDWEDDLRDPQDEDEDEEEDQDYEGSPDDGDSSPDDSDDYRTVDEPSEPDHGNEGPPASSRGSGNRPPRRPARPVEPAPAMPPAPPGLDANTWAICFGLLQAAQTMSPARTAYESKNKMREPEVFDGLNPDKLQAFFTSCEAAFRARRTQYQDGTRRVDYAVQYLSGSAQRWFQPYLNEDPTTGPAFLRDWNIFKRHMSRAFGQANPAAVAESRLRALEMKDHHRVIRYSVDFNELATQTDWNDAALSSQYWRGLAPRIKDIITASERGKPRTLEGMRKRALNIDHNYWERQEERKNEGKSSSSAPSDKKKQNDTRPASGQSKPAGTSSSSNAGNSNTGNQSRNKDNSSKPSGSSGNANTDSKRASSSGSGSKKKKDLTGKLNNSGKLTEEERARRLKEGLCSYCGEGKHSVDECRTLKAKEAAKASGRAATTSSSTKDAGNTATEGKN